MRTQAKRDFARTLRRTMTDAERLLWYRLRNRAFGGWKFRRQVPVGPCIVDFACIQARLVVELDGGQHVQSASDAPRAHALQRQGWRVLRFWNHDALLRTDAVLSVIHAALEASQRGQA